MTLPCPFSMAVAKNNGPKACLICGKTSDWSFGMLGMNLVSFIVFPIESAHTWIDHTGPGKPRQGSAGRFDCQLDRTAHGWQFGDLEHKKKIAAMVAVLLPWYAENARDLPWRRTKDPY